MSDWRRERTGVWEDKTGPGMQVGAGQDKVGFFWHGTLGGTLGGMWPGLLGRLHMQHWTVTWLLEG